MPTLSRIFRNIAKLAGKQAAAVTHQAVAAAAPLELATQQYSRMMKEHRRARRILAGVQRPRRRDKMAAAANFQPQWLRRYQDRYSSSFVLPNSSVLPKRVLTYRHDIGGMGWVRNPLLGVR